MGAEASGDARTPLGLMARLRARLRRAPPRTPRSDGVVTPLPPVSEGQHEVSLTVIEEGVAYVRISYALLDHVQRYEVIEPPLDADEKEVLAFVRETLVGTMDGHEALAAPDRDAFLREAVEQIYHDHDVALDEAGRARVHYYIRRDLLGYGPLDVLMRDPMIEDVSCDGPNVPLYVFHREHESLRTNVVFPDEYALDLFVIRLAQRSGRQISIADPLLDATLPDKSRLQASLSKEVTTRGSSFTIRRFREDPMTPPELVRLNTMDARMAAWLWLAMEAGASLLVAGGTASGKTTTLNAASLFIPPEKKIVSIEDTRELNLPHENWVPGLTRSGFGGEVVNGKYAGSIDMYRLLEAALRQRPEYLVVGEVRGAEALTLFQAMATGHAAYSTMHADSVSSAVYRLENEPINVPRIMIQTVDAFIVQSQVRIGDRLVRRIREIVEIDGVDPDTGDLLTNTVFRWDPSTDTHVFYGKSRVVERAAEAKSARVSDMEEEWTRRTNVMDALARGDKRGLADVTKALANYHHAPHRLEADAEAPEGPHADA